MKARLGGQEFELPAHLTLKGTLLHPKTGKAAAPVGVEGQAGATGRQHASPYRSKWEVRFAQRLDLEQKAGVIRAWVYEPMSIRLSKGKYHRPDFLVWHDDGRIEIAQVKGHHPNIRASMTALKWAAKEHPWFLWTLYRWEKGGWHVEQVNI